MFSKCVRLLPLAALVVGVLLASVAAASASARDDVSLEYQGNNVYLCNHSDNPILVSVAWETFQDGRQVGQGGGTWSPLNSHEKAFVGSIRTPPTVNKYWIVQASYAR